MTHRDVHPEERLSAYADGELPPEEAAAVEEHLETCTECRRELAVIRSMGEAMSTTSGTDGTGGPASGGESRSVWDGVRRRIVAPTGWLLVVAGLAVLAALAVVEWFRTGSLTPGWLATTAVAVGIGLVAVNIGWEQYREWKHSPYRDVRR